MPNRLTYISLFSSAGVGCYGFKMEGFECIATNELIERRLAVQKANNKCKYDSGYILGDISEPIIKQSLFDEISMWRAEEQLTEIDVVIATPPCQGMSVANHKKTSKEIVRNSLVIESIEIISEILPKVIIFENVPLFMKTRCTDRDGVERSISEAIYRNLEDKYSIYSKVINFKDYGACSSRSRALVIAVRRDLADYFSPFELFPAYKPEISLFESIGHLKPLAEFGEIDSADIYHSFRPYPMHMRDWITDLSEGESAFDNQDIKKIPHRLVNGKIVINQRKNGDKYRRQIWDKVGPCVHTRNDLLASQNTVHPNDDRVFSIRELMTMMTVPSSFCWVDTDFDVLNGLSVDEKRVFLKKNEMNIRQSLGEAVPTEVFRSVASNIKNAMSKRYFSNSEVIKEINDEKLEDHSLLIKYVRNNPHNLGFASLCRLVELANSKRKEQEAYFSNKTLITEMIKFIPSIENETISVVEPSVGSGNFIPFIVKMFEHKHMVNLTLVDIDENALTVLKELLKQIHIPENFHINYLCKDFLDGCGEVHYDLAIGNPPFSKSVKKELLEYYRANSLNKCAQNTSAFFLEKSLSCCDYVCMIMPKFLLNTNEFAITRNMLSKMRIDAIIDFGERGFDGVLIETISLSINPKARPALTTIVSLQSKGSHKVRQSYICDKVFPYWLIYRDKFFDSVCKKMQFDVFDVFRDRQLTKAMTSNRPQGIRVLKARNISDDGTGILDINGYDAYINPELAKSLSVYSYLNNKDVYLTPNMTYKPRVIKKPTGTLVNGSAAILILKEGQAPLGNKEMKYFSSDEYREFYRIARNRQTRSLNVDNNSVFFFGRLDGTGGS